MAFSKEIYVDPSLSASPQTGTGTIGDPYSDLEYAIINDTFDTDGTRINIKAGTTTTISAGLQVALADTSVTPAWVPTANRPMLAFQGYTAVAGDGGRAHITAGGAATSIVGGGSLDNTLFADLEFSNVIGADIFDVDNYCQWHRCVIHTTDGIAINADIDSNVVNCLVYNAAYGVGGGAGARVINSIFKDGPTYNFIYAVGPSLAPSFIYRNIITVSGAGNGIRCASYSNVINNSVYCTDAGTGTGVYVNGAGQASMIANNVVEGFSGVGGVGFALSDADFCIGMIGYNSAYNCETAIETSLSNVAILVDGGAETLTASPFTDAANFDFSPVDTGSVKEGSGPPFVES